MTREHLISANNVADMDRYANEYLPVGGETRRKYDSEPIIVAFEPDPVAGEWNYNHTFVAEFPSADAARACQHDDIFNSDELEQLRDAVFDEKYFSPRPSPLPRHSSNRIR